MLNEKYQFHLVLLLKVIFGIVFIFSEPQNLSAFYTFETAFANYNLAIPYFASKQNSIPFSVFANNTDNLLLNYIAFLNPQTFLLDDTCKVVKNWKGILTENLLLKY